jgi:hypothetical protein
MMNNANKKLLLATLCIICQLPSKPSFSASNCLPHEQKDVASFCESFFTKLREKHQVSPLRGKYITTRCELVFEDHSFGDISNPVRSELDCNALHKYGDLIFEFVFLTGEYALGYKNLPKDQENVLAYLPEEISKAIRENNALSDAFSPQSEGINISSKEDVLQITVSLERINSLFRRFLKVHPPDKNLVTARLDEFMGNAGFDEHKAAVQCETAGKYNSFGVSAGNRMYTQIVFPYGVVLAREKGKLKIYKIFFLTQ